MPGRGAKVLVAAVCGVGDVARDVAYMRAHGGPEAALATGTEPFRGPLLPLP